MTKLSKTTIKALIISSIIILLTALYFVIEFSIPKKPVAGRGDKMINNDVKIGGEFILKDHNNEIFNSESLKGKLSLIYFGFSYCPDICPTSLNKLSNVLETLDKYKIDVNAIFITIDPSRDTSELLKSYLSHFHNKIIGLTGTEDEIKLVADKFKVYYAKAYSKDDKGDDNYMLDHTSFLYLMDENGKYLKHFYFNSTPDEIINFIRSTK